MVTRKGFEGRIRELVTGHITLERIAGAMLSARATLKVEYEKLHKIVLTIVREDAVCRRLMTVPSVGPLVAITYKSAMDDPNRIAKSKAAGALFGLTPKKYQSGEKDVTGGITRAGDEMVRTALYEAAWGKVAVAKALTHVSGYWQEQTSRGHSTLGTSNLRAPVKRSAA